MPNYNKKKKCFMIKLKNWKKKTKISKVIFLLWKTKTRMKKQWSLLKMFKYLRTIYTHFTNVKHVVNYLQMNEL